VRAAGPLSLFPLSPNLSPGVFFGRAKTHSRMRRKRGGERGLSGGGEPDTGRRGDFGGPRNRECRVIPHGAPTPPGLHCACAAKRRDGSNCFPRRVPAEELSRLMDHSIPFLSAMKFEGSPSIPLVTRLPRCPAGMTRVGKRMSAAQASVPWRSAGPLGPLFLRPW
jgi:hypothetical protein